MVLNAANDFAGGTTLTANTLEYGSGATLGSGALTVTASSTLRWGAGNTDDLSTRTVTLSTGTATFDTGANNVTLANPIGNLGAGALTKAGVGMLILNGANTYTGTTTIGAGTLQVGNANALKNSVVSLGVANGLTFTAGLGTATVGGLTGSVGETLADTAAGVVTLQVVGAGQTYTGVLSGLGAGTSGEQPPDAGRRKHLHRSDHSQRDGLAADRSEFPDSGLQ